MRIKITKQNFLLTFSAAFALVCFVSCGQRTEKIEPIYQAENIQLKDAHIQMWNSIDAQKIEPFLLRKITRTFLGWIPGVGQLIELPFDLAHILIPPLSVVENSALPKDTDWNDPKVLSMLKSIKLGAGYLRIIPIAERGRNYKPERCWIFFECKDPGFDEFLSGISIFLMFKDLRHDSIEVSSSDPEEKEVLLASADTEKDYDKEARMLFFNVSDVNLRPYMTKYENFEVKVIAKGGFPEHNVYLDGKLRLDLTLQLSKSQ